MARYIYVIVVLFAFVKCTTGDASGDIDFNTMRIKELREFLADRGLSCKACSEKKELIEMAEANRDVPPLELEEKSDKFTRTKNPSPNIDEVLEKLKSGGFGGSGAKIFTADDLKNMDFDKFRENGGKSKKRSKRDNTQKRNHAQRDTSDQASLEKDTIEL